MTRHALTLAAAMTAAGTLAFAADAPATRTIEMRNAGGAVIGQARFTDAPNGVLIHLEVKGLTPGWHGIHLHEKGDCSAADFTSAGGHVHTRSSMIHGLLNPDANESGDLPNLYVAADGTATAEMLSTFVSMNGSAGRPALADTDGSALVIHANPDDYSSQPIGGAGARVACGVIPKAG